MASYDRKALLSEVAEMISGRYAAVHGASQDLVQATQSLCDDPSKDELSATKNRFEITFLAWERTAAFRFGPADDKNLGPEMSFSPTDPKKIEAVVSSDDELDTDFVASEGAGSKGLFALEYLLYADGSSTTVEALGDERRCTYLTLLAQHVEATSKSLAQAWDPKHGDYQGTLASAGEPDNTIYPAELSAISALLTSLTEAVDVMKAEKLGEPIGRMDHPDPSAVESPYAGLSLDALLANLEGARDVWMGTEHNFDQYLASRDAELADTVRRQFGATKQALEDIPSPLSEYVSGDDLSEGDAAYDALGELERLLATDVSASLAVSLGFNANDGD